MRNQKTEGIELSLKKLFPSTTIISKIQILDNFITEYNYKGNIERKAGFINNNSQFILWFKTSNDKIYVLSVSRKILGFTAGEIALLKTSSSIIETFDDEIDNDFYKSSMRLASKLAFETLLIASFLRNRHDKRYSNIANILFALKDLTFERYEGVRCSSGFIYSNEIKDYIKAIPQDEYEFVKFGVGIELLPVFFDTPSSFRYVDGKNSFYLIDSFAVIHGIVRVRYPKRFNIIDRLNNKHLKNLVNKKISTRKWIAYVGINNDINVLGPHGSFLKWSKNHWSIRERSIVEDLFVKFKIEPLVTETLVDTIFSLSELRQGTVILIPNDEDNRPNISGMIDQSKAGDEIRKTVLNTNIETLHNCHSFLGILSSDGLTTISKSGNVLGCGEIISLNHDPAKHHSGGGRSQAALMASKFGLAVKVSEDGPISIFQNGVKLISL